MIPRNWGKLEVLMSSLLFQLSLPQHRMFICLICANVILLYSFTFLFKIAYSCFKGLWTGVLCKRCSPVFQVVKPGYWLGKLEEERLNVKKIQFSEKQCDQMKTWPCSAVFHCSMKTLKFALHKSKAPWKVSWTNYMAKERWTVKTRSF